MAQIKMEPEDLTISDEEINDRVIKQDLHNIEFIGLPSGLTETVSYKNEINERDDYVENMSHGITRNVKIKRDPCANDIAVFMEQEQFDEEHFDESENDLEFHSTNMKPEYNEQTISDPLTIQSAESSNIACGSSGVSVGSLGPRNSRTVKPNMAITILYRSQYVNNKFKCNLCPREYTSIYKLRAHQRMHAGVGLFFCGQCGRKFSSTDLLDLHMKLHIGQKSHVCDVCGKGFSIAGNLRVHQRIHTGEKPYKCDECNKAFTQLGDLQNHKRMHTGAKPYICCICNKRFTRLGHVKGHLRNVHRVYLNEIQRKNIEMDDGMSYLAQSDDSSNQYKHEDEEHYNDKPHHCTVCGKCFKEADDFKKHQAKHLEKEMSLSASKNNQSDLSDSLSESSLDSKQLKCDLCPKKFRSVLSLKRHKRLHSGVGLLPCEQCGKSFTCISDLSKHKKTHTGEKPHECNVCGKRFSRTGHLREHHRIHTGDRSYKCTICNKSFIQLSHLQAHQRVHAGEKPYACTVCEYRSTQVGNLRAHMRSIHKIEHTSARQRFREHRIKSELL